MPTVVDLPTGVTVVPTTVQFVGCGVPPLIVLVQLSFGLIRLIVSVRAVGSSATEIEPWSGRD